MELTTVLPAVVARPRRLRMQIGRRIVAVAAAIALVATFAGAVAVGAALRPCVPSRTDGGSGRRLVSACTGTVLVLRNESGGGAPSVERVDLDGGRVSPQGDDHLRAATIGAATSTLSQDHLAVVDGGEGWSIPLRPGGGTRDLGPASKILDDGSGGWWVIREAGPHALPGLLAHRVRGATGPTTDPLIIGDGVTPLAGTTEGLLVRASGSSLALVGGAHPRPLSTGLDVRDVLAVSGEHVVVTAHGEPTHADAATTDDGVWLLDLRSGRRQLLGIERDAQTLPAPLRATFSADGSKLAVLLPLPTQGSLPAHTVAVVDVASGRIDAVPGGGTAAEHPAMAWSPDGLRLFFAQAGGPVHRSLAAFRLGSARVEELRYFPGPLTDLVAARR
ncbi:MAG: hypothetical protein NVS3B12_28050 [Acidimicrobiales bacterium]